MELAFEEFEETLTDYSGALEEAFEVIDDLNSTAVVIQDEDQSDVNARLLEVSVESYLKRVGLNSAKYKKQMALESFASSAASNVKKAAILVWEKIKAALTALYKKVTDFFKFLFNKNKETEKKINEAEKELEEDIKEFKKAADAAKKEQNNKVNNKALIGYNPDAKQTESYKVGHAAEEDNIEFKLSNTHSKHLYSSLVKNNFDEYVKMFYNAKEIIDIYNYIEKIATRVEDNDKMQSFVLTIGNATIGPASQNATELNSKCELSYNPGDDYAELDYTLKVREARWILGKMRGIYKTSRKDLHNKLNNKLNALQDELEQYRKQIINVDVTAKERLNAESEIKTQIQYVNYALSCLLCLENYLYNLTNSTLHLIRISVNQVILMNTRIMRKTGWQDSLAEFYEELF